MSFFLLLKEIQEPYLWLFVDDLLNPKPAPQTLPLSQGMAVRLYTGTRVTSPRLRAVEACEDLIRKRAAIDVVRCRIRGEEMRIELLPGQSKRLTPNLLAEVSREAARHQANISGVTIDAEGYRPGRAFIVNTDSP